MKFGMTMAMALLATASSAVIADDMGMVRKLAENKFEALDGMPTCVKASVQSGDPSKGASIIAFKGDAGCTVPKHWHTPAESVMVVSGSVKMRMIGGATKTLGPGGFALAPSKHQHVFTCVTTCVGFVSADGPLDIHYVDDKGAEITPEVALKKS